MRDIRVGVIFNASKDRRRLAAFIAAVKTRAPGLQITIYTTRHADDTREQTRQALAGGAELLVAAGGDGTLLGVLAGDIDARLPIAVLPLGLGNDCAHMLGVRGQGDAIMALCDGIERAVDVGRAHYFGPDGAPISAPFCSTAGVGAMARVFDYERRPASRWLKRVIGNAIWPLLTLRSFLASPVLRARVAWDQRVADCEFSALELSKVRASGGVCFTPDAALDSGHFDVWRFRGRGLVDFLRFSRRLFRGDRSHLALDFVAYHAADERLRDITVTPERPMPVHLNGDLVGTTPVRFEMLPFTMPMLAPRPASSPGSSRLT